MTESGPSFLQMCEEEFKNRFSENDEEFMKVKQAEEKTPPIVDDNYEGRNQRFNNRSHDRDRHNQNWQRRGGNGRDNFRDRGNYYGGNYRQQGYRI